MQMADDQDERSSRHLDDGPGEQNKDLAVAVASLAFGCLVLAVLIPQSIGPIGSDTTILAVIGSIGLLLCGLVLGVSAYRNRRSGSTAADEHRPDRSANMSEKRQALCLIAGAIIYAFALEWIGFLPASYLTLAGLFLIMGVRSLPVVLLVPAAVVLVIYLGIDAGLGASLPEGRLEWTDLFQSALLRTERFDV